MSALSRDMTADQFREVLKKQADEAHAEYVDTKRASGDASEETQEAYKRWSVVDNARLKYDRALVSALQALEES